LEDLAAYILTLKTKKDGGTKSPETLVSYHNTTRYHNTKDLDWNLYTRKNFKSRT